MDNRVALIGIMVENPDSIETMNRILHEYGQYIIGRMGLPYRERGLSIISIVLDAPMNQISCPASSACWTASVRKPSIKV